MQTPMPTPPPVLKRKQDVIDLDSIQEKRAKPFKPVAKTSKQKEEEALFQLFVTAHTKFDKLPIALRNKLQADCQTAFYGHMFTLQAGIMPEYYQPYNVFLGLRTRMRSMAYETTIAVPNVLDLSMANAALLDYFVKHFKGTYGSLKKEQCVELKIQGGLVNPEFVELYAVRYGELGWGFDTDGCLSLYVTGVVDNKIKEKVLYVKAGNVELKGEN